MVLPPSPADALAPAPPPAWIVRLSALLELAPASVMILVEAPDHASIGAFIRAVGDRFGHVFVVAEMEELLALPEGSLVALCPRAEDAEWLNIKRPWIVEHSLRVLIWADRELAGVLHERAPDFFDWISHHQECPPTPPEFAIRGLQLAREGPGIVWGGTPEEFVALLRQVEPEAEIVTIDAAQDYRALVDAIAAAGDAWLLWTDVDGPFRVRRVRWALAECRRFGRSVLTGHRPSSLGWAPLLSLRHALHGLAERLRALGLDEAARVAVCGGLNPALLAVASALRNAGRSIPDIQAYLTQDELPADSPGLGRAQTSQHRRRKERALQRKLQLREPVDPDEMEAITATASWDHPMPSADTSPRLRGWLIEALLRGSARTPANWLAFARVAEALGDYNVQLTWASHGLRDRGGLSPTLEMSLTSQYLRAVGSLDNVSIIEGILSTAQRYPGQVASDTDRSALLMYAATLGARGRLRDAETLLELALSGLPSDTQRTKALTKLEQFLKIARRAPILSETNGWPDNETSLRATISARTTELGPEHPEIVSLMVGLARVLQQEDRYDESLAVINEAMQRHINGIIQDAYIASELTALMLVALAKLNRLEEAVQYATQILPQIEENAGREHPAYISLLSEYARILAEHDRIDEAETYFRLIGEILFTSMGPASDLYHGALLALIQLQIRAHRWQEAETNVSRLQRANAGVQPSLELSTRVALLRAQILRGQSRFAEAEATLRRLLEQLRRLPTEEWADIRLEALEALGDLLVGLARYADAEALYRDAIADEPALAEALSERFELAEAQAAAQDSSAPTE